MYLTYSLSKCLVCFHILAIQLLIRSVLSLNLTNAYLQHKCLVNQGEYKPGSAYEENLNHLFHHLSTYHFRDGFKHTSHGEAPNSVTIIFQCRGDSYGSKCRSCYTTAVAGLRRKCPKNKGGIIWYDQCFLDVSTVNSGWKTDYENTYLMHNPKEVSGDTESFNKKTRDFLYELALKADKPKADGSGLLYYAAGEKKLGKIKLYAMVQCALDIFHCKVCLEWCIKELSKCCDGKEGARVLGTSCNVRYELYPFIRS